MKLRGVVRLKTVRRGTKSEHDAFMLVTPSAEYKLRRRGGNPFRDEGLAGLENRNVRVEGEVDGAEFFLDKWEIED
ncbi:MAG TPA: hypothetical protein VHB46_13530 [Burkholderiales bacterium]|nr:hypothetical protein [Burkholderiales bacterium]